MRLERVEEWRGDEPYVLGFCVPLKRVDGNSDYDKNPQIIQTCQPSRIRREAHAFEVSLTLEDDISHAGKYSNSRTINSQPNSDPDISHICIIRPRIWPNARGNPPAC